MATSLAFDTEYYLSQNPDVLQYLLTVPAEQRTFNSAAEHYIKYGAAEGRDPNAFFDTSYYLAANPDVLVAYQQGIIDPFSHFVFYGAAEGRNPNGTWGGVDVGANFDEEAYLAANPDVADAIEAGTFTSGYQHFVLYGQYEDRPGAQLENGSSIPGETGGGIGGETFTLTTGVDTFNGTANNDVFQAVLDVAGAAGNTVNPFDSLNGNGGTDTLNTIVTGAGTFAGTTIQNIEIINLDQNLATVANLSAASFVGATQVWQINDATAIAGVGVNTTAGFRDATVAIGDTVTFTGATGSIALDNVGTGSVVEVLETTANTLSTLNVSGDVAGAGNVEIALAGGVAGVGDVDTLNLSLSSTGTVDIDNLTDLATIDASGSTGNLTLLTGAFTQDVTVTLGSGNDTVVLAAAATEEFTVSGGDGNDNITGGANDDTLGGDAGNDIINGGLGDDAINGGAGNDVIIGNVGADNITLGAGDDVAAYAVGDSFWDGDADDLDVITDFNAEGNDTIDFTAVAGLTFSTQAERIAAQNAIDGLADTATLTDAIAAVEANIGAGDVAWFTFGENTYVHVEGPGITIELTGTVALSTADFVL